MTEDPAVCILKKTIKEVKDTTFSNKEDILSSEPLYYDALNKKLLKFSDMVAVSKVINDMAIK